MFAGKITIIALNNNLKKTNIVFFKDIYQFIIKRLANIYINARLSYYSWPNGWTKLAQFF